MREINFSRTLFIMITNNCNLKCSGCMQSCDRNKNPFYITIEDLTKQLKAISNKILTVNGMPIDTIHLTGGDPLTHPKFIEICEVVKKILPTFFINVSSNGIFISKLTDVDLLKLKKMDVHFQFSLYPDPALLKMQEKNTLRLDKFQIGYSFGGGSHFYFSKQNKFTNSPNFRHGYDCRKCKEFLEQQVYVTLVNGRIYTCQKAVNVIQTNKELANLDSFDVFELEDNQELIQNYNTSFCTLCEKTCSSGGEEYILWNHHDKNAETFYNYNLKELYIKNYEVYHSIQHDCKNHIDGLKNELFQQYLPEGQKRFANTRFLNGKGDIFIPFKRQIPYELKTFLLNYENIINYNIYLVGINISEKDFYTTYSMFIPYNPDENLNIYYLKANNMVSAYKSFLDNSYLNNKYLIDIEELMAKQPNPDKQLLHDFK